MNAALKTECSLSTRLINKVSNSDDDIMVSNRRQVGVAWATVALVDDFFLNSDEVSRMMPGKADATKVSKGKGKGLDTCYSGTRQESADKNSQ